MFFKTVADLKFEKKISRNIKYSCIVQIVKMKNMILLKNVLKLD